MLKYSRVLIKVSGEALSTSATQNNSKDTRNSIYNRKNIERIAKDIIEVYNLGVQVCIVVGGGNIYRGKLFEIDRVVGDYMGMLATVINALALQNVLEQSAINCRVLSAIPIPPICESYIRRRAIRHLEKGRIVIFAAGIGNPFFTTDTAAVLRAIEVECNAIFKATQVDGVYSNNPIKDKSATRFNKLSYTDVLANNYEIMDSSAISLARDNSIPILVFSINKLGEFAKIVKNQGLFTQISD